MTLLLQSLPHCCTVQWCSLYCATKGRVKKCWFIHICLWPTHPQNVDKNKKRHVVFLGFLAHLEPKKFLMFFHHYNPPPPPTGAINWHHPPPTTIETPHCCHPPLPSTIVGGLTVMGVGGKRGSGSDKGAYLKKGHFIWNKLYLKCFPDEILSLRTKSICVLKRYRV